MTEFRSLAVSRATGHVVGIVGRADDGGPVDGVAAQAARIIGRLTRLLDENERTLADVVRLRVYLTSTADWPTVLSELSTAFDHVLPPCTVVGVNALVEPWMAVELEVDIAMDGAADG